MYSTQQKYTPFLVTTIGVGVGSEMAKFAVFFGNKDSKNAFFDLLNGYIHPNNFKNKKQALGAAPNPSHLRGRRGRWQTLSTYPYGECWVDSKASRVKCDFVALDPSPSPWGSKTNRSGRAGNLSRLAKQPRSSGPLQVGGDNALW